MGIDLERVDNDVAEEFRCAICPDMVEDVISLKSCEHFCRSCINGVVRTAGNLKCPQ